MNKDRNLDRKEERQKDRPRRKDKQIQGWFFTSFKTCGTTELGCFSFRKVIGKGWGQLGKELQNCKLQKKQKNYDLQLFP